MVMAGIGNLLPDSPEAPESTPTPTASASATVASSPTMEVLDHTDVLRSKIEPLADLIISAEQNGNQIEVKTSIVDPRGDDGSEEAEQAVAICREARELDESASVLVTELDGTVFAKYQPNAGDSRCSEF